jgi:hypothetical protein
MPKKSWHGHAILKGQGGSLANTKTGKNDTQKII